MTRRRSLAGAAVLVGVLAALAVGAVVISSRGGEADDAGTSETQGTRQFLALVDEATKAVHAKTPEAFLVQVTYGTDSETYTLHFIDPVSHFEVQAVGPNNDPRLPRWFAPGVPRGGDPFPTSMVPPALDLSRLQKDPLSVIEAAQARVPGFAPVIVVLRGTGSMVAGPLVWYAGSGRDGPSCEVADAAGFSDMQCASPP